MASLVIVAGPNGSGKSTLTRIGTFGDREVIDPDAIATRLGSGATDGLEIAAAREALRRQQAALAAGRSLVVETTLAGRGPLRLMEAAGLAGYDVLLHYVCVSSSDEAVSRVRSRVAQGGHHVPEEDVRRRFSRSLANLPLAIVRSHDAYLYDNRGLQGPHRGVAVITREQTWTADRCPDWAVNAVSQAASLRREMVRVAERDLGPRF